MPRATRIRIPEPNFLQICSASLWLCGPDRDAFGSKCELVEALPELGEGAMHARSPVRSNCFLDRPKSPRNRSSYASSALDPTSWRRTMMP